ncbi:hypothetical protein HK096_009550, partial [Nowakowskiella sp. JEL0078]
MVTSDTPTIPDIFQDAARTISTHRRSAAKLRKTLMAANTSEKRKQFNLDYITALTRILPTKPNDKEAERVVEFLAPFLSEEQDQQLQERLDSVVHVTMRVFLPGLRAKDKNVRFRVAQILASNIRYTSTLDDELSHALEIALIDRTKDKDAAVRYHIFVDEEKGKNIAAAITRLLDDQVGKVRQTVMESRAWELQGADKSLLFAKIRDTEVVVRKEAFSRLAQVIDLSTLKFAHRERLMKYGLEDRDKSVNDACLAMLRLQLNDKELLP